MRFSTWDPLFSRTLYCSLLFCSHVKDWYHTINQELRIPTDEPCPQILCNLRHLKIRNRKIAKVCAQRAGQCVQTLFWKRKARGDRRLPFLARIWEPVDPNPASSTHGYLALSYFILPLYANFYTSITSLLLSSNTMMHAVRTGFIWLTYWDWLTLLAHSRPQTGKRGKPLRNAHL